MSSVLTSAKLQQHSDLSVKNNSPTTISRPPSVKNNLPTTIRIQTCHSLVSGLVQSCSKSSFDSTLCSYQRDDSKSSNTMVRQCDTCPPMPPTSLRVKSMRHAPSRVANLFVRQIPAPYMPSCAAIGRRRVSPRAQALCQHPRTPHAHMPATASAPCTHMFLVW